METWRPISGYEGLYDVSDGGRVRSAQTQKIKSQYVRNPARYPAVGLWKGGKLKFHKVHRTVLKAFKGLPFPGVHGCHNDGNTENNKLSNLRWDTHSANMRDKRKHGTMYCGERHKRSKLTADQIRAIRLDQRMHKEIAADYGVKSPAICRIKGRHLWAHIE